MFDLKFGISLEDIVESFDPLQQLKSIKELNNLMEPTTGNTPQVVGAPYCAVEMINLNSSFTTKIMPILGNSTLDFDSTNYCLKSTYNNMAHNPPVVLDTGA